MTNVIVALSLVFTPAPIAHRTQETHPSLPPSATAVVNAPMTSPLYIPLDWPTEPSSSAETVSVALSVSPPTTVYVEHSPIEWGMNRLIERGASPYELRVFGCLAWAESKNNTYAISVTNDRGIWQIHFPLHAWRFGDRDWRDPVANADVAFDIYQESGFRAWSTHARCGV